MVVDGEALPWPEDIDVGVADARAWISESLGSPAELHDVIHVKFWGFTARFTNRDRLVVFKVAAPAIFPGAPTMVRFVNEVSPMAAPTLLACSDHGRQQWMLFEHVVGTKASAGGGAAAMAVAEAVADVQRRAQDRDLTGLPSLLPTEVPHLLTDLDDQPTELVAELERARPALERWAGELDELVPHSIDHVDLHLDNAICGSDDRLVILDWEEAVVSSPLFSLERLLEDAEELGVTELVKRTYLERLLPDHAAGDRTHALALASALVPLKVAHEAREFARLHEWEYRHTKLTTKCLETAVSRWRQMDAHV